MYERPLIVGVSQTVSPEQIPIETALTNLGHNVGNMLFTEALCRSLANATLSGYDFSRNVLDGRDCIVLAAANWLASDQDFSWLVDRLEKTSLPIFIVGLGAQASLRRSIPKLKPGTARLIAMLAERSRYLSVRGEFTAEVLDHFGVKNVVVTGCPSLLLASSRGFSIPRPSAFSDDLVCVHGTRHHFNEADGVHKFIYHQALSRKIDIILQSELADMYFALSRTNDPQTMEKAKASVAAAYGCSDLSLLSRYLREHGKVFFNLRSWLSYLETRKFCVGTRIHGTVAALLAGVPAVLIVHDSRTLELAQTMSIPYVLGDQIDVAQALNFAKLYDPAAVDNFVQSYPAYYNRFKMFFSKNELMLSEKVTLGR